MEAAQVVQRPSLAKSDLFPVRNRKANRTGAEPAAVRLRTRPISVALKAGCSEIAAEGEISVKSSKNSTGAVPLFVGLPLDSVSDCNTINHTKAISAGLRALKLLGVRGVELPIWWCITQPESISNYGWSSYLALARMVRDAGLKLRVSLHLSGSRKGKSVLCLPDWIQKIAKNNPDVLFTDRSGNRHEECLSFGVDEVPVLDGKSPIQVFEEYFLSFRDAFGDLLGSTITDIVVGLGPNGELRYPSYPPTTTSKPYTGIGEFQCYDKFMLTDLKSHAKNSNNPNWGLGGPHDAPSYNQPPESTNFFKDPNGSWKTPYGDFFLTWYSSILLTHCDRLLSNASKSFTNLPLTLSAKVPHVHCRYKTQSRAAELTAGYYNGYDSVADIFARNSFQMVVPGMDLVDDDQPQEIIRACKKHGVRVSGENSGLSGGNFGKIKENLAAVDSFAYQRMGAQFFSPGHWPSFAEFVRSLGESVLDADDLVSEDSLSMPRGNLMSNDREMQAV